MLSTFPAFFTGDFPFSGDHFPNFETGFQTWEFDQPVLFPIKEPSSSNSGSETSNPAPVTPESGSERKPKSSVKVSSGSDEPDPDDRKRKISSGSDEPDPDDRKRKISSGSDEPDPDDRKRKISSGSPDDRKRKRMISNRESARRSRMRKQKHLENLRSQANRLKETNRELMNRLRLVLLQNQFVCTENECLRSEAVMLKQRLWDTRQVLLVRQLQQHLNNSAWPCNNVTSINNLPNNL